MIITTELYTNLDSINPIKQSTSVYRMGNSSEVFTGAFKYVHFTKTLCEFLHLCQSLPVYTRCLENTHLNISKEARL